MTASGSIEIVIIIIIEPESGNSQLGTSMEKTKIYTPTSFYRTFATSEG